jgi:hypothetical protein
MRVCRGPSGEVREVTRRRGGLNHKPLGRNVQVATIITSHRQNSAMRSAASASSALTRGCDSYFNRYLVSSEYTGCRSEDSEESEDSELATIPDLADIVKKR